MSQSTVSGAVRPTTASKRHTATATLVWIDSRRAFVVRWHEGGAKVGRYESAVPVHRRSTGSDSSAPQDEVEGRRLEHLARFVESIAARLPKDEDLLVTGPGTVHQLLAENIQLADRHARRVRRVTCQRAAEMTERQLIASLREFVGAPAPRKRHVRRPIFKRSSVETVDPYVELETFVDDVTQRS